MALVLVLEKDLATLAKLSGLLVALVLEHEARLEEQLKEHQPQSFSCKCRTNLLDAMRKSLHVCRRPWWCEVKGKAVGSVACAVLAASITHSPRHEASKLITS